MFEKILAKLRTQSTDVQDMYFSRLESVVSSANSIGWGYYEYISDIFSEYETEIHNFK